MKNKSLFKNITSCLLFLSLILGFAACEDVNNWDTDSSYSRMFSPVTFETARVNSSSVDLRFSSVPNAGSFVVEISEDSLAFTSIIKTVEVLADSIVRDSTSTSKVFLTTVKGLQPEKQYSARMKVTSNNNLPESRWVALVFKTPGEQILNTISPITENSATVKWEAGLLVTHVMLSGGGENKRIDLTQENISAGVLELTNLKDNTPYSLEIYNNEKRRGNKTFVTAQKVSGDGKRYMLTGNENIVDFLNNVVEDEIVLVIPAGANYPIAATWNIPAHIKSLTLWGLAGDKQAAINFKEMVLDNAATSFKIWIHNMQVTGMDASADYIVNSNATRSIPEFKIDGCIVKSFRGLFRMRGTLSVENVVIDNCLISNIGSYGLITIDDATVSVQNIVLKNSTVHDLLNTNVMAFKSKVTSLTIDRCTFYNTQAKDRYIANFNGAANVPSTFSISNSLFAASDAAIVVRATNPKISSAFVSDSYRTNEYTIDEAYPLSGVSDYNNVSTVLFEEPDKGNFKIKDTAIGAGKQPGDPRWW